MLSNFQVQRKQVGPKPYDLTTTGRGRETGLRLTEHHKLITDRHTVIKNRISYHDSDRNDWTTVLS